MNKLILIKAITDQYTELKDKGLQPYIECIDEAELLSYTKEKLIYLHIGIMVMLVKAEKGYLYNVDDIVTLGGGGEGI